MILSLLMDPSAITHAQEVTGEQWQRNLQKGSRVQPVWPACSLSLLGNEGGSVCPCALLPSGHRGPGLHSVLWGGQRNGSEPGLCQLCHLQAVRLEARSSMGG